MAFQWNFIIYVLTLWYTFNITELECRKLTHHERLNKTLEQAAQMMTEYPLGISEVFDNASGVFGKILGQIITKKKLLGIESFYLKK